MTTLTEQLRTEARPCPQCHYVIENPFSERCPRCLTVVPVIDPGCSQCVHRAGCPVSSFKKAEATSAAEHESHTLMKTDPRKRQR